MNEDFVDGVVKGELSFGNDIVDGKMVGYKYVEVPYTEIEGIKHEIALLGIGNGEKNRYRGRRVRILKSSLFFQEEDYGIYAAKDYTFPDARQDVSHLTPALETLLSGIDINAKHSILDESGEDSFLYAASTFDVGNERIFFLRLTRYDDSPIEEQFKKWANTAYSKLGLCFKGRKCITFDRYITHFAEQYFISYDACTLEESKVDEAIALIAENSNLRNIDSQLGKALSDPLYMEALCRRIEERIDSLF